MNPKCQAIEEKVQRVAMLNTEYLRLTDSRKQPRLGGPASPESIRAVEQRFGTPLPDDYRCFLDLHDGWQDFNGDNALLSTDQMLHGPVVNWIAELKGYQPGTAAERGHVIMASPYTSTLVFFDPESPRDDGGMDVVYWNAGELARYPTFAAFLDAWANMLQENIDRERSRVRKA